MARKRSEVQQIKVKERVEDMKSEDQGCFEKVEFED